MGSSVSSSSSSSLSTSWTSSFPLVKENPLLEEYTKRDHCVEEEDDTELQDESSTMSLSPVKAVVSAPLLLPPNGDYNYDNPFPLYQSAHVLYRRKGGSDQAFFDFFYLQ